MFKQIKAFKKIKIKSQKEQELAGGGGGREEVELAAHIHSCCSRLTLV